jgi:hypothetical protein
MEIEYTLQAKEDLDSWKKSNNVAVLKKIPPLAQICNLCLARQGKNLLFLSFVHCRKTTKKEQLLSLYYVFCFCKARYGLQNRASG